jgi:excisionase family DNA binding protein
MQQWSSAEQVAEELGLHVRTVRGYIRDGRLRAVRIGKQYRVARADLDAFVGRARPAEPVRVEVSAVVEVAGIGARAADRLATTLVAGAQSVRDPAGPLRLRTVYDDARERLTVIVMGPPGATADALRTVEALVTDDGLGVDGG